ncbi:MAG: alpha/beta hydrolase [Pseudolabrys sp.]|nr:alpha/beta hydrolase [Pseudolabrys sp.]
MRHIIIGLIAILAISAALWKLNSARDGIEIVRSEVGATPVTVFRPVSGAPAPVAVIAHGFAGSQQLMQPFALTLARNGYVALTFDFLGHGAHQQALPGGLADQNASMKALIAQLGEIAAFARKLPGGNGRMAVLGHSMASDIVVRHAQAHPDTDATIAVSVFSPVATVTSPRNLLVIDGALEPSFLKDEGRRLVGMATSGPVEENVTYGNVADGTARRLVFARGVEHIGVLYSSDSMAAARDWLNEVYGRSGSGFIDARGPWLGLLYLGLIALAWALARLLPPAAAAPRGLGLPWRLLLPAAIAPALLTPLILWKMPTGFLPLLLGDYLVLHFALYGLLTAGALYLAHRAGGTAVLPPVSWRPLVIASAACIAFSIVAIGIPTDRYVSGLALTPVRLPLVAAMLVGTLLYFIADEWTTRGPNAPRGAYAFTKFCFLASLAIAISLNLQKLFFLIIIVPAILLLFVVYGLFSGWAYRRTFDPLPGALCAAITFAWAIAVTFPMVGR